MIIAMTTSALLCVSIARSRAMSSEGHQIDCKIEEFRRHMREPYSYSCDNRAEFDELCAVADECRESNWDGQGAAPVSEEAYRLAYRFLETLPVGFAKPGISPEPDGQLAFEWHSAPRRTFSVSISPDGNLHYAALLGPRKRYGTEPFFDEVPKVILDLAVEAISDADAGASK
jgi:hypothetical protein